MTAVSPNSQPQSSRELTFEMLEDAFNAGKSLGNELATSITIPDYIIEQFHDVFILPEMTNRELLTGMLSSESLEERLKFKREYNSRDNKDLDATRYHTFDDFDSEINSSGYDGITVVESDVTRDEIEIRHKFRCREKCALRGCRCSCHSDEKPQKDF